ncbi:MAG: blmF [Rhodospirillales bacterium]|nr:blmF [Rhodospirillales bacterium]
MADPQRTISLLCPTRGRPDYIPPHIMSIMETTAEPDRLELMFYVDRDDPELANYESLFAEIRTGVFPGLNLIGLVGDRIGTPKAINAMAGQSTGRYLMISNDDLLFKTKGWDHELERAGKLAPDGIFNIFLNDGYLGPKLSCFPIVGRPWYEALGYLAPVLFDHCNVDLWIHRVGDALARNYYLEDVHLEHRHFEDDGSGNRFNWQVEGAPRRRLARDNAYFQMFDRYMQLDIDILRDAIAGRPSRYPPFKDQALTVAYNI